jgi:hypothetical protein
MRACNPVRRPREPLYVHFRAISSRATGEWCRASRGLRSGLTARVPGDGLVPPGVAPGHRDAIVGLKTRPQQTILCAKKRDRVLVFTLSPRAQPAKTN